MDIWIAATLFFGGAICHAFLSRVMRTYQCLRFTVELTNQIITLISLVAHDLSIALKKKYNSLEEAGMSEEDISLEKKTDQHIIKSWKILFAQKTFAAYPKAFKSLLTNFDWDGALKPLDDIYEEE
jgi:hypothetical protein